jgi:sodium transport system permease protein
MNFRQIAIVYRKELLDALRDRRTIISTIVIPMVMFPLIGVGFTTVATKSVKKAQSETANVMIIGAENSPGLVETIKKTEGLKMEKYSDDYTNRIGSKALRAAIEIPKNLDLDRGTNPAPVIKLYNYAGEIRSQMAVGNLQKAVRVYRDKIVEKRLADRGLSRAVLTPFETREENVAPAEKVGGNLLGGLIPYLIIFMSFVGCMAPALDLAAGEKERGTIETILASPVGRTELVLGKFFLVLTTSMMTTAIAMASNSLTFLLASSVPRMARNGPLSFDLSFTALAGVFLLVLPLAITFAAVLFAIASFARNYREAQTYVSPLMMVVVVPAMAALLPGFDLDWKLALVPVLNVSLVSKEILSGTFHWGLISVVFLSSCVYAMAALSAAVAAFKSESVLFRT